MTATPTAASAVPSDPAHAPYIPDTVRWLERAVIGLNLCPFAKAVHAKGQIHYAVVSTTDPAEALAALRAELAALASRPAAERDTTLIILPHCLHDFLDFNDFLGEADDVLTEMGLDGVLQVASFHPKYQFAMTGPDDMGNHSNRAPYPTLHLLREESIDRAVEAFPQAEAIFERNIAVLESLGAQGWAALGVGPGGAGAAAPGATAAKDGAGGSPDTLRPQEPGA